MAVTGRKGCGVKRAEKNGEDDGSHRAEDDVNDGDHEEDDGNNGGRQEEDDGNNGGAENRSDAGETEESREAASQVSSPRKESTAGKSVKQSDGGRKAVARREVRKKKSPRRVSTGRKPVRRAWKREGADVKVEKPGKEVKMEPGVQRRRSERIFLTNFEF